jgi:hypothetical protein
MFLEDNAAAGFGAPIQDSPQDNTTSTSTTSTSTQSVNGAQANGLDQAQNVQDALDINDPRFTSEDLNVNTDADAYAQPAPPPDGKYRAKLTLEKVKDDKGQEHDFMPMLSKKTPVQAYLATALKATIIDPSGKYDGIPVYDRWVGTFMSRDGSTKIATILSRLRRPDGTAWIDKARKYNHKEWMDLFIKALAGEPEIGLETQWEWSCTECGKEAKKNGTAYPKSIVGMQKFPYNASTREHTPELKCQVNPAHGYSRAYPSIGRFLSLSELKPQASTGTAGR